MKLRPTIVLLLIVLSPLVIVGWLGAKVVRDEQVVVEQRFRELATERLRDVRDDIVRSIRRYEKAVLSEMEPVTEDRDALRVRSRRSPLVRQFYVASSNGLLLHPPVARAGELTIPELEALERTRSVWDSGDLGIGAAGDAESAGSGVGPGWYAWYWGDGLQWMVLTRRGDRLHAAEINRMRFLSDLVGDLPASRENATEFLPQRFRLVDASGATVYQWGTYEGEEDATPVATLELAAPLGGWTLESATSEAVFGTSFVGSYLLNMIVGFSMLALAVVGLTYYFWREQSREMREASQRVSFVNQVSHELKTPLTNIRMYADLLEKEVPAEDDRSRRYLSVITSESGRLSRLIGNVLTFSRGKRRALRVHRVPGDVDEVLRSVLDHFRPSLEARGIEVEFTPGAGGTASLDPDLVEQIVGNLVSNVEKYAAAGGYIGVRSHREDSTVTITVADRGPGLPPRERERVFQPFYRIGSSLTEGVTGAGIGLAIARELARLHGGDLTAEAPESGALFRLTLSCPRDAATGEV